MKGLTHQNWVPVGIMTAMFCSHAALFLGKDDEDTKKFQGWEQFSTLRSKIVSKWSALDCLQF